LPDTISIAEQDPRRPELFRRQAERIRTALGGQALRIGHTRSTSVDGFVATPIVDILLVVDDSADESTYVPELEAAGYATVPGLAAHQRRRFAICTLAPSWPSPASNGIRFRITAMPRSD
jgi:GrpB-like predicted nucleotidyltransferase (UPF0157 family)